MHKGLAVHLASRMYRYMIGLRRGARIAVPLFSIVGARGPPAMVPLNST